MIVTLDIEDEKWQAEIKDPLDISILLSQELPVVNCFYAPLYKTEPVKEGDFIGDTSQGGVVNFKNIFINPHGNGTHTECVGHIAKEVYKINDCLSGYHYAAQLLTVMPTKMPDGDRVVFKTQVDGFVKNGVKALILRTEPNDEDKKYRNYSGLNAPYLDVELVKYLVEMGIQHLIVDLPSVDKEEDSGKLLSHRAFWQYPQDTRLGATITELVFVPSTIKDGVYLVNIQIGNYDIDVSPSKIILFPLSKIESH